MAKIGNVREYPGEVTFEWEIKDFFSLSNEKDIWYESPKFYFSGTSWQIWIYPNGEETEYKSNGWISIYIMRMSTGSRVSMHYSFGFKTVVGRKDILKSGTAVFDKRANGTGHTKFISKSMLMEKKAELTPSDVLTVICTLKNSESNNVNGKSFILAWISLKKVTNATALLS